MRSSSNSNNIKDSVIFERQRDGNNGGTELQVFRVKISRGRWIEMANMYSPPSNMTGHTVTLSLTDLPTSEKCFVAGDFNAHSPLWDSTQPSDNRGEEVTDWLIENDLSVLNDGSSTRHSRTTGTGSAPDITVCGSWWSARSQWRVGDEIGGSDHLPLVTTLTCQVKLQPIQYSTAKWKRNNVDWSKFTEEVESKMSGLMQEENIKRRILRFNSILTEAAEVHVGKSKPGKRTKCWMTPAVKTAVKKRNRLRANIRTHREEWLEACAETREEIRKAKEESWKGLLEGAVTDADDQRMWGIIKSLNGTPDTNSPNEAMKHNGRLITNPKKKADIFLQHYAKVSKLTFSKEERDENRRLKKALSTPTVPEDGSCSNFKLAELERAIAKMKKKGAAGPDDIPPTFLKALGPSGLAELLAIFNVSFNSADCPQIWRNAIIIPLLKSGKAASELASYRPVSLTSCVVKILERMIAERLYYLAETKGWLSRLQAGFRKGRSCEDQILRIVQSIDDGFQQKPMKRSVLVLLDFSKAYDTVWRQRLLLSMIEKGVPLQLVRWLYNFLNNRQARVRFCNTTGRSRWMRQGLPQGSVLAPLLFLFYINNLAEILPNSTTNAMFADDVSILATRTKKEDAASAVQKVVNIVHRWSKAWKISLNTGKSEAGIFMMWTKEAKWSPSITIEGKSIPFNPTPRLLGVLLDRQLSFGPQVEKVTRTAASKCRILAALSNSEWGWRKEHLRTVFFSHVKSVLDYASSAWQPWLSSTNMNALERAQNRALRHITGQHQSTPVEALRAEAAVTSYATSSDRACLTSWEKAVRCPEDHPRRTTADNTTIKRSARHSWRSKAAKLSKVLPATHQNREPFALYSLEP